MKTRKISVAIISILFIALWLYAGFNKLMDPEFETQLMGSPYLENVTGLVKVTLPWAELIIAMILIGGMLLNKRLHMLGLYLSFFLMFLFTAYIYAMLYHSHYTPCSCGGILNKMGWGTHLIFNITTTLLAGIAILLIPESGPESQTQQRYSSVQLQTQQS